MKKGERMKQGGYKHYEDMEIARTVADFVNYTFCRRFPLQYLLGVYGQHVKCSLQINSLNGVFWVKIQKIVAFIT